MDQSATNDPNYVMKDSWHSWLQRLGISRRYWEAMPSRLMSTLGVGCFLWNVLFTTFAWDVLLFFHFFPLHLQQIKGQWGVLPKSVAYYNWIMYISGILTVPYRFLTPRITESGEQLHENRCQTRDFAVVNCCSPPAAPLTYTRAGSLPSQRPTLLCPPCVLPFSV